ncbi:MAG: ribosome maturation factor RimP, partial [Limnochordales bacterium]
VFIDKPGGVTLDDCQAMSRLLGDKLDEVDPIEDSYTLEVSSPGVERPLTKPRDFVRFAGHTVQVRTYGPVEGRRNFKGELLGLEGGAVVLRIDGEERRIPVDQVAKAHLVAEF